MMRRHGELAWFEINAEDVKRSAAFYGAVFGWEYDRLDGFPLGDYLIIRTEAGTIGGIAQASAEQPPGGASSVLYFEASDIPDAIEAALAVGGKLRRPYMDIGGDHGFCAIIEDPDGNHVGLWADH